LRERVGKMLCRAGRIISCRGPRRRRQTNGRTKVELGAEGMGIRAKRDGIRKKL